LLWWNQRGRRALEEGSQFAEGGPAMLVGVLVTFLVVILVLYLINMLPMDGRAKQIARVIVIIIGIVSLLKYLAVF
jgi:hypothetical protein